MSDRCKNYSRNKFGYNRAVFRTKLAQFWHRFADDKSKGMWYNGIIQKWGSTESRASGSVFPECGSLF